MGITKKVNHVLSREFLIKIKTNKINNEEINNIIEILNKKIQKLIINLNEDNVYYIYESYKDEENENLNKDIDILLHFNKCNDSYLTDSDDIICTKEYPSYNKINPYKILHYLDIDCEHINSIGVSGISEKLMKELWWEMISEIDGYMTYRSYFINHNDIYECREKSYNFGWDNYPPKIEYYKN